MKVSRSIYYLFLSVIILSCGPNQNKTITPPITPVEEPTGLALSQVLDSDDNTDRLEWQRPEEVISLLGNIEGKTIADIGPGTGYFSFRFLFKGAKVIATDIDPNMIRLIETFKMTLPVEMQSNIETRLADPEDPNLRENEVDIVTIINVMYAIENRSAYLRTLRKSMKPGATLMIIDWKKKRLDIEAPPIEDRIPIFQLEEDVINAGFTDLYTEDSMLQYQVVLLAKN